VAGFTQSMDAESCVSNESCEKSMGWVWTLSILGFIVYSLNVVVTSGGHHDGAIACLLFYFQMSSFASDGGQSDAVLEFAQVRSVAALYEGACYAPDTGAYAATVYRLLGPLCVLVFGAAWTGIIQKLQPFLQQRKVDVNASYSGTLAVAILHIFSSVTSVVFSLVECTGYGENAVVFIDGTMPCKGPQWTALLFIAAVLFMFPAAFACALRAKWLPHAAHVAVADKFTEPMMHWGAVSLAFRLFVALSQLLRVAFPNLLAFIRMFLSTGMLVLLVHLQPYVYDRSFWIDVACYVCLIAQFGLQIIATDREYLGVSEAEDQESFYSGISRCSSVLRCAIYYFVSCLSASRLAVAHHQVTGTHPSVCTSLRG
jgi:hypothetical protein